MTRLFTVKITSYAVVIADDESHAVDVAQRHAREIVGDDGSPGAEFIGEVRSEADLVDSWDGGCVPYGGDGNSRIGELLRAQTPTQPAGPQEKTR